MNLSRLLSLIVLALVVGCPGSTAQAAQAKTPPAPPDVRKIIKAVDAKTFTITMVFNRDKSKHVYKVDDMTKLKLNNQDGKFADIKVGMVVDDFMERDFESLDSLSLSGYGTPPPVVKPKVKPKH